jgi:glycosyltransferase involved in cell wall biosynthesis
MRVLFLGTYPIDLPLHGGQRRAARIVETFRSAGAETRFLSVVPDHLHKDQPRSRHTFRAAYRSVRWFRPVPYAADVFSGLFAATDERCVKWLCNNARAFAPTHIVLEQPFMFPALRALKRRGIGGFRTIYSSQNLEAPLKREILLGEGTNPVFADKVARYITALERTLVKAADLVIACSKSEHQIYRSLGAKTLIFCRNGTDPWEFSTPPANSNDRFLLTVGSGHPPNAAGFVEMMLNPALLFLPPDQMLAVAGAMCNRLGNNAAFLAYREANMRRLSLHPKISDRDLVALKNQAHGFFLPIRSGGGSNLKTAEAIISGKWVVATTTALRSFEEFVGQPGIIVEDDPARFCRAIRETLARAPLELDPDSMNKRSEVLWSRSLAPLREWIENQVETIPKAG